MGGERRTLRARWKPERVWKPDAVHERRELRKRNAAKFHVVASARVRVKAVTRSTLKKLNSPASVAGLWWRAGLPSSGVGIRSASAAQKAFALSTLSQYLGPVISGLGFS